MSVYMNSCLPLGSRRAHPGVAWPHSAGLATLQTTVSTLLLQIRARAQRLPCLALASVLRMTHTPCSAAPEGPAKEATVSKVCKQ